MLVISKAGGVQIGLDKDIAGMQASQKTGTDKLVGPSGNTSNRVGKPQLSDDLLSAAEIRGFIFGGSVANASFVMLTKQKKQLLCGAS